MNIQWFPGHMAKTRRILADNLKLVDVVIELLDARIPLSSKNPEIDRILKNKPRVVALNKSDLADEKVSKQWSSWYNSQGYANIFIDSLKGTGIRDLKRKMREIMKDRIERDRQRGRIFRPIRTMIVGIPNVGKSSLINRLAGKSIAVTGDRPGVTRGKQWINVNNEIQLLDTPGILWPKFEDKRVGLNLAITGAIKDDILDTQKLASVLLEILCVDYPQYIKQRYKLDTLEGKKGYELLEEAGRKRGCLVSGGEVDLTRISSIVLDELRGGKIGRITLEKPEEDIYRNGKENDIKTD
ncbi:MAG: ribosome biogenesis GTPase YlqF [Clostridium sp.]|nr:ribosome biogenesis GTPase YlqF [Clostridium sp.]